MPAHMTVDEVYAELRARTLVAWQDDEDKESEDPFDESAAGEGGEKELTPLEKLRKGVVKAKVTLRFKTHTKQLAEEDWDAELLEMLKASYREVTGRAMPDGMSPALAEMELRKATMSAWKTEHREDKARCSARPPLSVSNTPHSCPSRTTHPLNPPRRSPRPLPPHPGPCSIPLHPWPAVWQVGTDRLYRRGG
jgi:hypothetical protein